MKGFALSDNDVLIQNGEIQMIEGTDLTCQTVRTVLNTNKGEWFLNPDEGINFRNILGKKKASTNLSVEEQSYIAKHTEEDEELNKLLANRLDGVSYD